jgi:hypothetical protein
MASVYTVKRKEPRVKLNTPVAVTVSDRDGVGTSFETTTIDVSPHGASVRLAAPVAVGAIVRFAAKNYSFASRAVVRSITHDRGTGEYLVGLEYLDDVNPIVVWKKRVVTAAFAPSA